MWLLLVLACGPDRPACGVHWSTDAGDPSVPLSVEISRFSAEKGATRLLGTRPVQLVAPEGVAAGTKLEVTGDLPKGITVLDARGSAVALPTEVLAGDLPLTLYVQATAAGDGSLSAAATGCEPHTLELHALAPPALVGRRRADAPGFGFDDLFVAGETVDVALDPALEPDGIEAATAIWVPHQDLATWATGPELAGEGVAVSWNGGTLADAGATLLPPELPTDVLSSRWDLVFDVDGDGRFSAGDRLDQGDGEGIRFGGDFGAVGPYTVSQEDVSGGDWLGERVYWPEDLDEPRPLVVISHGNGHQYTWYDYLGQHLASWGFVVMAHENDTMPGIETASTTTLTNTDWLLGHLDEVGKGALVGKVDPSRIAWMGHSRGGEGVVRAWKRLVDGDYVPDTFGTDDIRVILSIAPTVFNEVTDSDPAGVRYHLLAGSSDGDVTGGPESPVTQSFRILQAATETRSSTYIYGASHEDFDCCGADDGIGPDQLEREDVQAIAKATVLAVMAESLDDDAIAGALLGRDPMHHPLTTFDTTVLATWHGPDATVIDDFQFASDLGTASSQAAVVTDVTDPVEGLLDDADLELTWTGKDPMNAMTQASERSDEAAGVVFEWAAPASFAYVISERYSDWSGSSAISLAMCQGSRAPATTELDGPVEFSVTLTDRSGTAVTRSMRPYGTVPAPYERGRDGDGKGWSNAFSTVRMPLSDFTSDGTGLDLAAIAELRLDFAGDGDSPQGRVGLDDVEVLP